MWAKSEIELSGDLVGSVQQVCMEDQGEETAGIPLRAHGVRAVSHRHPRIELEKPGVKKAPGEGRSTGTLRSAGNYPPKNKQASKTAVVTFYYNWRVRSQLGMRNGRPPGPMHTLTGGENTKAS